MKKTNFFKLFLVGAMALAVGFTSCEDSASQKDFETLCEEVDALKSSVEEIQTKLNSLGDAVKDVRQDPNDPNKLTVSYTNGNTADVIINIEHPDSVPGGTSFVEIKDGNWWIGGKDTGYEAGELAPKLNEDGTAWLFPVVNAEGAIEWAEGPAVTASAYAVNNDGQWTLYLPTEDGSELQAIALPGENTSAGLNKIDILGWVEDFAPGDNLSVELDESNAATPDVLKGELYDTADDTFVVYYNVIEAFTGDLNAASQPTFTPETDSPVSSPWGGPAVGGRNLADIYTAPTAVNPIPTTRTAAQAAAVTSFGIATGTALTTLDAQNKGLIVQANGANLSDIEFVLEDSQKNQLPITFKKPVLVTGLLTRAAADSDLWFIEGAFEVNGTFTNDEDFAEEFTPEALYSLVTPDGFRSEYTPFTFIPTLITSLENQVTTVDAKELVPASTTPEIDASFYVKVRTENKLAFEANPYFFITGTPYTLEDTSTRHLAEIGVNDALTNTKWYDIDSPVWNGNPKDTSTHEYGGPGDAPFYSNTIIDWYMVVGSNPNDTFVTTEYNVFFDNNPENHTGGKTFTVGQLPDDLTLASFNIDVYKLGIDGTVYYERLRIHPVREEILTSIDLGDYLVEDGFPSWDVENETNNEFDYLGSVLEITEEDLQPMWDKLATYVDAQTATMEQRWKDEEYGAMSYTITNVTIQDMTNTQNGLDANGNITGIGQLGRFMFPNVIVKSAPVDTDPSTLGVQALTTGTGAAANATPNAMIGYTGVWDTTPVEDWMMGQSEWQLGDTATGFLAKDDAGEYINSMLDPMTNPEYKLYDSRAFDIYPNYAYNNGTDNVPSFVINKKHTFTIKFYDQDGMELNTLKVSFTPKLPNMNDLFVKEAKYWNTDLTELNAFYKVPTGVWADNQFYNSRTTTLSPFLQTDMTNPLAINTYYNVYSTTELNPTHTSAMPYDGGFSKFGQATDEDDTQWLDNTSALAYQNADQVVGANGEKINAVTKIGTQLPNLPGDPYTPGHTTIIALYNQYPATTSSNAGYYNYGGKYTDPIADKMGELAMTIKPGKYIGFYEFAPEQLSDLNFTMKIMSALEKGTITGADNGAIDAGTVGDYWTLTADDFIAYNYNNTEKYSLFKNNNAYDYKYVRSVEFFMPDGIGTPYNFYNTATGVEITTTTTTEIAANAEVDEPHIAIVPNNLSQTTNTFIGVKVIDRFGKTKVVDNIPLNIIVNN
jgi:hypothetical protein